MRSDTLVVSEQNFTVVGPQGWRWEERSVDLQQGEAHAFTVTSPGGDSTLGVAALNVALWSTDDSRFVQGLARGIGRRLPPGWTLQDVKVKPAQVSTFARALSFRITLRDPNGTSVYRFGYLLPGKLSYLFVANTLEEAEPSVLRQTVDGFRLLDPGKASVRLPAILAIGSVKGVLIVLAALFALVELAIRVGRRGADRTEAPAMAFPYRLLVLAGVIIAMFLTSVDVGVSDLGDTAAYALGAVSGVLFMAWVIAYLTYGRRSKRNLNRFALLFSAMCFGIPFLSSIGNMSR